MIEQLSFTTDGRIRGKVEAAIERLRCFEPEEGYYVAFSGGKDSQCVYHLCKMAGVKFDAHYAVTSVDPPELVQFIKEHYPDAWEGREHQYREGCRNPVTMWSLIQEHNVPPSRALRYCCADLKEPGGSGRVTVTGVRWKESINRAQTHGVVDFQGKKKGTRKIAEDAGASFGTNKHGDIIMNDDNDAARRVVESCYRTRKTIVNPIVDWDEEDVWTFLNSNGIPHCCVYDEGKTRLGCIGCPLAGDRQMRADFERWPKYKELYIKAFNKMIYARADEMVWLERIAGTRDYVAHETKDVDNPGEKLIQYWLWATHPTKQTIPDWWQVTRDNNGDLTESSIRAIQNYDINIVNLAEVEKKPSEAVGIG